MLIVSSKVGESVVINGNIVVTLVEIRDHKVLIGIEAPKDVPIWRDEIQKVIDEGVHRDE